jgi:hypothetical protein
MDKTPPDPEGEMPPDMDPMHWAVVTAIAVDKLSYSATAARLGRSPGWVSKVLQRLRLIYGPDFCPAANSRTITLENARIGGLIAGRSSSTAWTALREEAAGRYGETAVLASRAAQEALQLLLADPDRLKALTTREILDLARTGETLARRADALAGIQDVNRAPVSVETTNVFGSVDLSGLESASQGGGHSEVLDLAEVVIGEFHQFRLTQETGAA